MEEIVKQYGFQSIKEFNTLTSSERLFAFLTTKSTLSLTSKGLRFETLNRIF